MMYLFGNIFQANRQKQQTPKLTVDSVPAFSPKTTTIPYTKIKHI